MKHQFLLNEIWILTFGGAFQRSGVYSANVSEDMRSEIRNALRSFVDEVLVPKYVNTVPSDIEHVDNIKSLCETSTAYKKYLSNGAINFGVSQKLLNLHLKYRWCIGDIKEPPHFPVDRIIQKKLRYPIVPWTQMKDETDYMKIIAFAKAELKNHNCKSLATLELKLFDRRN
ncbi:hypothetical protein [Spongiimicrobium salis]|uniref:hypothetical protein n=1 Tax=Spongiimicrobium salis TaxID=1667022 RepID=UPI00374D1613